MKWPNSQWPNIKAIRRRIREFHAEVQAKDPFVGLFGPVVTVMLDSFVLYYLTGLMAIDLARRWQSHGSVSTTRCLASVGLVVWWTYIVRRWLLHMRWSAWWAPPYVMLVLCPWTWVLAERTRYGVDAFLVLLLQSPIIVTYVWRVRDSQKNRGGR